MSGANERQVAGSHYKSKIQHWDYVADNELDYFQGQITKYVTRWKKKNGITDLMKAQHFLEKYIEVETRKADELTAAKVTQRVDSDEEKQYKLDLARHNADD